MEVCRRWTESRFAGRRVSEAGGWIAEQWQQLALEAEADVERAQPERARRGRMNRYGRRWKRDRHGVIFT